MAKQEEIGDLKALSRLAKFLPTGDLTLIVLKGHLLIEEQLTSLIERNLTYPAAVERFNFFQSLCLAKAMYYKPGNAWVWLTLEKLNEVRNHLAHKLEAGRLGNKSDAIYRLYPDRSF